MKTSTQLANQIFDALYDEDDLRELKKKKVIAQEIGYELSVKAIIDVELACVNDMAEELERLRSERDELVKFAESLQLDVSNEMKLEELLAKIQGGTK